MIRKALRIFQAVALLTVLPGSLVVAGPHADDLSKCFVNSTTEKDKTDLVRWIFAAAAVHPDVSSLSAVTDAQRQELTRTVGQLFERLLTESCRSQYRDAVKSEGDQILGTSFGALGQVAMKGLMGNPAVAKQFAQLGDTVDKEKIKAVLQSDDK